MVNLDNVVRAAIAEATKDLPADAGVEVAARRNENGVDAFIVVSGPAGEERGIVVREQSITDYLAQDDLRAAVQRLVDQLAAEAQLAAALRQLP